MSTEYAVVLTLVSLVLAVAIAGLTVPLIDYHRSVRDAIVAPVP
jgi:hypothetical protein